MTPHALIAPARLAGTCVMRAQSDERLVDLVRAGNERAFEAVVERYSGALLRHCRRFLPDGRAEDALQQTLLRAHAGMVDDVRPLRLRPWLFRIATNASIDLLRQPGWAHEQLDPEAGGLERPDQAFERHEELRAAIAAVQDLPRRQRDVIVLRELEGRSYDEIAAELGLSGGAVRQLLHRGRAGLRRAASALTPPWLLERLSWSGAGEPVAARVAELTAGAGGAAGLTKALAAVLAAGTVAGGVAVAPLDGGEGPERARAADGGSPAGAVDPDPVAPAGGTGGFDRGPGSAPGGSGDVRVRDEDGETRTETRRDGDRTETRERTEDDAGNRTETRERIEEDETRTRERTESADGTRTETETRTRDDGRSETRTRVENPDGTRTETRTRIDSNGTVTTETKTDGDSSGSGSSGSDSSGSGSSGSGSDG